MLIHPLVPLIFCSTNCAKTCAGQIVGGSHTLAAAGVPSEPPLEAAEADPDPQPIIIGDNEVKA